MSATWTEVCRCINADRGAFVALVLELLTRRWPA